MKQTPKNDMLVHCTGKRPCTNYKVLVCTNNSRTRHTGCEGSACGHVCNTSCHVKSIFPVREAVKGQKKGTNILQDCPRRSRQTYGVKGFRNKGFWRGAVLGVIGKPSYFHYIAPSVIMQGETLLPLLFFSTAQFTSDTGYQGKATISIRSTHDAGLPIPVVAFPETVPWNDKRLGKRQQGVAPRSVVHTV
eukprot:1159784-Pelagomonas_calceolata.AAC.3